MNNTVVVAIGGNSLIRDEEHISVQDQYETVIETARHLADIVESGKRLVVVHGNGPQVGFILRRSAVAHEAAGMHEVPLSSCVADTQGAIGFMIQQALDNELLSRGIKNQAVTMITRTLVDANDERWKHPSKPIGSFFSEEKAENLKSEFPDWVFVEDSGRGFRRVVTSPIPVKIVEIDAIRDMSEKGYIVIAAGGGGIPVIETENGLNAVDAVIDKDLASALLAEEMEADQLVISTSVTNVYINFGKPDQKMLEEVSMEEMKRYAAEGHFAEGSMLPKINAAIDFLEKGGKEVIITSPEKISDGINHTTGTRIVRK
jgi:carbamate kinase